MKYIGTMEISENLILIVEDDIGLAELIKEQISDMGYDCKVFTKARDAIHCLQNTLPLLLILDYGLPDLTGNEFIQELRENGTSIPPFVVATGRGDERIAVEMMKLGARDYIVKDSQFLNFIQHLIQRVTKEVKTERKLILAEKQLSELNRFNAQIIESAKEGIIVYDKQLNYVVFNKFIEELTETNAIDVIGKNVLDIFPFVKKSGIYDILQQVLKGIETEIEFIFEVPNSGKSGWVLNSFSSLKNADNDIIGVISIIHDITERKHSELAIRNNHDLLQKLLFRSSDFIGSDATIDFQAILDTMIEISGAKYGAFNLFEGNDSKFHTVALYANQNVIEKVSNFLGFNIYKKKWNDDPVRSAKIKDSQITRFESLSKLTGNVIFEKVVLLIEKTFEIGAVYVAKVNTNVKLLGDFTLIFNKNEELHNLEIVELFANQIALYLQRNQSELDIKENENKFRLLFNENPQPMCVYDLETLKFVEINQAAIEHYGYSREEFLSMTIQDIRPPEDIPAMMQNIKETGLSLYSTGEWRHIKKNGQIIDVKITSRRIRLNGRESRHVLIQDITEQKIVGKELKDKMDELMRFHNLTIDRELTMIELKKEINRLLNEAGKPEKYTIFS